MESPPSPQALIQQITAEHDLTETQIAAELTQLGVKTSQPTINRIRRGTVHARKELALVEALLKLRTKLRGAPPLSPAATDQGAIS